MTEREGEGEYDTESVVRGRQNEHGTRISANGYPYNLKPTVLPPRYTVVCLAHALNKPVVKTT